jgi:hypothetical protein
VQCQLLFAAAAAQLRLIERPLREVS